MEQGVYLEIRARPSDGFHQGDTGALGVTPCQNTPGKSCSSRRQILGCAEMQKWGVPGQQGQETESPQTGASAEEFHWTKPPEATNLAHDVK